MQVPSNRTNITALTEVAAEQILLERGSRNEKEREWTRQQIKYLRDHGRSNFSFYVLTESEFCNLTFNGLPDQNKIVEIEKHICKAAPDFGVLFLRDVNDGEDGSFYVENGKHRVSALQRLLKARRTKYSPVSAIVVSKEPLG